MRRPQEMDERSLALHRLFAAKIRREPTLLDHAKQTLARWRSTVCVSSQPYLKEWGQVLNLGLDDSLNFAAEDSQRANAMRQSSPFSSILSNPERFAFLKKWNTRHAAP